MYDKDDAAIPIPQYSCPLISLKYNIASFKKINFDLSLSQSIEISLSIAEKIFLQKMLPQNVDHPVLGILSIKNQMIEYPIIFD